MATEFVWAPPYAQGLESTRVCVASQGSWGDALIFFYFDKDASYVRERQDEGIRGLTEHW
jgi:hypothetical protein